MTETKSEKKAETKSDKLEREYIINLRRQVDKAPIYKRTPKAIRTIKEFLVRHMKIRDRDLRKIKLDRYLNEFLWARGIRNPQTRIKVKAIKEGEIVKVELVELPAKLKFKKLREERREREGTEAGKKKKKETHPNEAELKKEETPVSEAEAKEKKEEEEEKKSSVVEVGKEIEKAAMKRAKHEAKVKSKEPKRQFRQALQK